MLKAYSHLHPPPDSHSQCNIVMAEDGLWNEMKQVLVFIIEAIVFQESSYWFLQKLMQHNIWTLFQWQSKVSTNWSNTWKHACYCAFMYTSTEKHVCFHVISLFSAHY